MKWVIVTFAALLITVGPTEATSGSPLYECTTKDVQRLGTGGTLERNYITRDLQQRGNKFIFDEQHGVLRYPLLPGSRSGRTRTMTVIQKGSNSNDAIGLAPRGIESKGADVFRILAWKKGMPFIFLDTHSVYTGNCKIF